MKKRHSIIKLLLISIVLFILVINPVFAPSIPKDKKGCENDKINLILIVDSSGSMNWLSLPGEAKLNSLDENLKNKIIQYKNDLTGFSNILTDEEKAQYYGGCSSCRLKLLDSSYVDIPDLSRDNPNYERGKELDSVRDDLEDSGRALRLTKADAAKKAMTNLLDTQEALGEFIGAVTNVAVVSFEQYASKEGDFTIELDKAKSNVNKIYIGGGTNIGSGLEKAFDMKKQSIEGEPARIILLSDGRTNSGWHQDAIVSIYTKLAEEENVVIDTIGFGMIEDEIDKKLLQTLAENTGGIYTFAETPSELSLSFIKGGHTGICNELMLEETGTVGQDEEKVVGTINPDYKSEKLLISLNWPGSELELVLKDSRGNPISESEYEVAKEKNILTIIVNDPPAEELQLSVYGKDVPEGELDYNIIVSQEKGNFRTGRYIKDNIIVIILGLALLLVIILLIVKVSKKKR